MEQAAPTPSERDLQIFEFCQDKQNINVTLLNEDLWRKFHAVGTEMVVNKPGRRLFPLPTVSLSGLDPDALYTVALRIEPVCEQRFAFTLKTGWEMVGRDDAKFAGRPRGVRALHARSPTLGRTCQLETLVFNKLKLTNDESKQDDPEMVVLRSMHKYILFIDVMLHTEHSSYFPTFSFQLPATDFIAVTAYQNPALTQLKIQYNPFAKAFRDSGPWNSKRKRESEQGHASSASPSKGSETCSVGPQEKKVVPFLISPRLMPESPKETAEQRGLMNHYNWLSYWFLPRLWQAANLVPAVPTNLPPQHYWPATQGYLFPLPVNPPPQEPFDFSLPKSSS